MTVILGWVLLNSNPQQDMIRHVNLQNLLLLRCPGFLTLFLRTLWTADTDDDIDLHLATAAAT